MERYQRFFYPTHQFKILVSVIILIFSSISLSFAQTNDSTSIRPPNVKNIFIETRDVLHYTNNISFSSAISSLHPCSGEVSNQPFNEKVFPVNVITSSLGGSVPVYYFFTCSETYKINEPYYESLKNNRWVTCKDDPTMSCSIQVARPALVLFVAKLPYSGKTIAGPAGGWGADKVAAFYQLDLYLGLTTSNNKIGTLTANQGQVGLMYTWAADTSARPGPGYGSYLLHWKIKGENSSSVKDQAAFQIIGENMFGNYECSANGQTGQFFTFTVTSAIYGQTCTLSCAGPWAFLKTNRDTWYSWTPIVSCA